MRQTLVIIAIICWQQISFCQNNQPVFILPIMQNTNEYSDVFYSENKSYNCEAWLHQYTQLFQSNRSSELQILEPSEKYTSIKDKAQKDNTAKFIFELYNTFIFKEHTSTFTAEQLLDTSKNNSYFDPYILKDQLLITVDLNAYDISIYDSKGQKEHYTIENNSIALTKSVPAIYFIEMRSKTTGESICIKKIVVE